jgi:hypothetical protein
VRHSNVHAGQALPTRRRLRLMYGCAACSGRSISCQRAAEPFLKSNRSGQVANSRNAPDLRTNSPEIYGSKSDEACALLAPASATALSLLRMLPASPWRTLCAAVVRGRCECLAPVTDRWLAGLRGEAAERRARSAQRGWAHRPSASLPCAGRAQCRKRACEVVVGLHFRVSSRCNMRTCTCREIWSRSISANKQAIADVYGKFPASCSIASTKGPLATTRVRLRNPSGGEQARRAYSP